MIRVTEEELEKRFTYHEPSGNQRAGLTQTERYEVLRSQARTLAGKIVDYAPLSREQSLALTKLEEAVMWANAAIARNE